MLLVLSNPHVPCMLFPLVHAVRDAKYLAMRMPGQASTRTAAPLPTKRLCFSQFLQRVPSLTSTEPASQRRTVIGTQSQRAYAAFGSLQMRLPRPYLHFDAPPKMDYEKPDQPRLLASDRSTPTVSGGHKRYRDGVLLQVQLASSKPHASIGDVAASRGEDLCLSLHRSPLQSRS